MQITALGNQKRLRFLVGRSRDDRQGLDMKRRVPVVVWSRFSVSVGEARMGQGMDEE